MFLIKNLVSQMLIEATYLNEYLTHTTYLKGSYWQKLSL